MARKIKVSSNSLEPIVDIIVSTDSYSTKYKELQKIGEGSYSIVIKSRNRATDFKVAVKKLKNSYRDKNQVKTIPEVRTLRRLPAHPNILQMLETHFDPNAGRVCLVFELMEMNLYELIKDRKRLLAESRVRGILFQLMRALRHLHRHGIFHRDVKPENVLVQTDPRPDGEKRDLIKLADLGSVREIGSKPPYTEYISTRWYRSPECLLTSGRYNIKMDVWAAGCVFYEVLTLRPLFPGTSEIDQINKIHSILGMPSDRVLEKFAYWTREGEGGDRPAKLQKQSRFDAMQVDKALFPSNQPLNAIFTNVYRKGVLHGMRSRSKSIELPVGKQSPFAKLLPVHISNAAHDLLRIMLEYDVELRPSSHRVLQHDYFLQWRFPKNKNQTNPTAGEDGVMAPLNAPAGKQRNDASVPVASVLAQLKPSKKMNETPITSRLVINVDKSLKKAALPMVIPKVLAKGKTELPKLAPRNTPVVSESILNSKRIDSKVSQSTVKKIAPPALAVKVPVPVKERSELPQLVPPPNVPITSQNPLHSKAVDSELIRRDTAAPQKAPLPFLRVYLNDANQNEEMQGRFYSQVPSLSVEVSESRDADVDSPNSRTGAKTPQLEDFVRRSKEIKYHFLQNTLDINANIVPPIKKLESKPSITSLLKRREFNKKFVYRNKLNTFAISRMNETRRVVNMKSLASSHVNQSVVAAEVSGEAPKLQRDHYLLPERLSTKVSKLPTSIVRRMKEVDPRRKVQDVVKASSRIPTVTKTVQSNATNVVQRTSDVNGNFFSSDEDAVTTLRQKFDTLIMQRARRLNKEREEYYQGSEEDINANAGVYRYGRRAKLVHGDRSGRGPYYQYQTLSYHSPLMQQQQQKPDRLLQKRSTFERTLVERGHNPPPTPRHVAGSSLPVPVPQNVRDQIRSITRKPERVPYQEERPSISTYQYGRRDKQTLGGIISYYSAQNQERTYNTTSVLDRNPRRYLEKKPPFQETRVDRSYIPPPRPKYISGRSLRVPVQCSMKPTRRRFQ